MKVLFLITLCSLFLSACKTTENTPSQNKLASVGQNERHQKIYKLEHRDLPYYVFASGGDFYSELSESGTDVILDIWTESVDSSGIEKINVKEFNNNIIIITFPEPNQMLECYYAAIIKLGSDFRYITLEKTIDFSGSGMKSCLCEWTADGSHLNFGPRNYDSIESFEEELLRFIQN